MSEQTNQYLFVRRANSVPQGPLNRGAGLFVVRAERAKFRDIKGNEYIDL